MAQLIPNEHDEWLETDGLGGFASGTANGIPTRKYHALLNVSTNSPATRFTLLNHIDATLHFRGQEFPLSSFRFTPGICHPDGSSRCREFTPAPFPRWHYRIDDTTEVVFELFMPRGFPVVALRWIIPRESTLTIRPLVSGRDLHQFHKENPSFSFAVSNERGRYYYKPYDSVPGIFFLSNGDFQPESLWYRNFHYARDEERGYMGSEDLASLGTFTFSGTQRGNFLIAGVKGRGETAIAPKESAAQAYARLSASEEQRRAAFPSLFHRAAEDFIVQRGKGYTVVAGYPWFADWGRDTFISLRGLALTTKKREYAALILEEWSTTIDHGMVPNRFVDGEDRPDYNSVDAALWYVVAAYQTIESYNEVGAAFSSEVSVKITSAIESILTSYSQGTRYNIKLDSDGLLACGEPGSQLTWMDAKYGDYPMTPRIGKPVEIQALWLNALRCGALLLPHSRVRWESLYQRGVKSFSERFWNEPRECLFDVVDCDHIYGTHDERIRPNQTLAIGGLPFSVIDTSRGLRMIETIRRTLLTPLGLRTLAPGERGYAPHFYGDEAKRCFAYHQGTVWPWLIGPFIEGWLRVQGDTPANRQHAYTSFLEPLINNLKRSARGHVPEVADAEPPHTHGGCPFQAWSLAEVLRVMMLLEQ